MNKPTIRQLMQVLAILDMDEIIGPLPHQYVKATVEVSLTKLYAEFECAAIAQAIMNEPVKTPEQKAKHSMKVYSAIVHSKDFKFLGYHNDFGSVEPKEYHDCWNAGHLNFGGHGKGTIISELVIENGKEVAVHTCTVCKIYWKFRVE